MAITPVQEFFNKGLVNVRDASLLTPGELQQCDHCVYRPFDPAIHSAPGRQAIHSAAFTGPVKGLAWLSADNTADQLLAYNGPNLYLAEFTAITGLTWKQCQGVGTLHDDGDEEMVTVKYDTAYYILNGKDANRRLGFVTPASKVITTCTISGGVTVTSSQAKIFTDLVIGQTVTGTGVPAGTVISNKIYTITSGSYVVTSLTLSQTCSNGAVTLTFTADTFVNGRVMGMVATGAMLNDPTVNTGAAYAWPSSGDFGGKGFYWVFYTEAFIPSELDDYAAGFVESACTVKDKDLKRFEITTPGTQGVTVRRNDSLVNDGGTDKVAATHWIIYMSPRSGDPLSIPSRNLFVRVGGPIPISSTTQDITTTATDSDWHFGTATTDAAGYGTVAGRNGVLAPGGDFARFDNDGEALIITGFGIATSALTVTGIELEIGMAYNNAHGADGSGLAMYLERVNGGGTVTKSSVGVLAKIKGGPASSWRTLNFGGNFDQFDPSPSAWVGTDFFNDGSGSFRVFIRCYWETGNLDYFKIKVHYNGFPPNTLGANYRTVTYRSQVGTTVIDSAALPPPIGASTGAVFRGQSVTNSRTTRNGIFYSLPGFPEYYPKPYFMTFDSPKKDIVTCIKRVGSSLVVGLQDTIHRVNFLPTELDTDSTNGLAYEPIATEHGITGPRAAAVVDIPGLGTVLAYCSFKGIHYTDSIRPRFLNTDLDWNGTVKRTALASVVLAVYPAMNWLVMYYCPAGATHNRNTRALIFDYSPDKLKDGPGGVTLPAIGPVTVSGRSATSATLAGVDYYLTGHEVSGFVYAEDQGSALPTGYFTQEVTDPSVHTVTKNTPNIRTRLFYAAGVERDTRNERTYLRYDNDGPVVTITGCTLLGTSVAKTNAFGSVIPGMTVSGEGIRPGTIVISVTSDDSATLSHAVDTAGTTDLTFDTGTLQITQRGQGMREDMETIESGYISTHEGNLNDIHLDNTRQALEIQITKATLPDGSLVDLSTAMRLHYFTSLVSETGIETGRAA